MQLTLFIVYFLLFSSFIYFYKLNRNTGFSSYFIIALFGFKVLAGCINLYLYNNVFKFSDVSFFHWQSIGELKKFHLNPSAFLYEWLFNWGDYKGRLNFFNHENSPYWSNLGSLFHSKFMLLSNIFSLGNIYVNVIFYNIAFFIGQLLLYKSFYQFQPHKKWLLVAVIFFTPSVLFWCSGIHKDGWILMALGFICYYTIQFNKNRKLKNLLIIILSIFLVFIIRYFYVLCLLPAYLIWICTFNSNKGKVVLFGLTYAIIILLFFTIQYIFPSINPMQMVANRQHEFMNLDAFSDLAAPLLEPTLLSYFKNLPYALYHVLFIPTFHFSDSLRFQLASLDSILIVAILFISIIFIKKQHLSNSYYLFLLFFTVSVYLFIGYTIPNSGALVRYKSEFTALLLPSLISLSEIPFLKRFYAADN